MNQSTRIAIAAALTLLGCNKDEGAASGKASTSGTASAGGATKACPEGAPLCVNLPAGHAFADPRSGAWGGNVSVLGPDKNSIATLYWVQPGEFETRTMMNQSKIKATNGKDEEILGGKGRYQEWDSSDPKEDRHFIETYIKTDKNTLQCTGATPKGDAAKIAALQAFCRSMTAK